MDSHAFAVRPSITPNVSLGKESFEWNANKRGCPGQCETPNPAESARDSGTPPQGLHAVVKVQGNRLRPARGYHWDKWKIVKRRVMAGGDEKISRCVVATTLAQEIDESPHQRGAAQPRGQKGVHQE